MGDYGIPASRVSAWLLTAYGDLSRRVECFPPLLAYIRKFVFL